MFAKIENNQVVEYPIVSIVQRFPNISFPADPKDTDLPTGYVRVYAGNIPEYIGNQKLVSIGPVKNGTSWVQGYEVQPLSPEELQERETQQAQQVREQRNQLLASSDWTQARDIPDAIANLWAPYRQQLRDVTAQSGFPGNITWPQSPN